MNKKLLPLKEERDTDPQGRGYAAMTPEAVAADINEKRFELNVECFITDRTLAGLFGNKRRGQIMTALLALTTAGIPEIEATPADIQWIYDQLTVRTLDPPGLDVGNLETRQTLTYLGDREDFDLTPAEATTLCNMGRRYESTADRLGYQDRGVSAEWILRVRGL